MKTYLVTFEKTKQMNNGYFIVSGLNKDDALEAIKTRLCKDCRIYNQNKLSYRISELDNISFNSENHLAYGKCSCTSFIDGVKILNNISIKYDTADEKGKLF